MSELRRDDLSALKKVLAEILAVSNGTSVSANVIETNSTASLASLQILDNIVSPLGYAKSQLFIVKDGTPTAVELDTTNPYSMTAIPVTLVDIAGTTPVAVNLAGDLEVYIKHIADPVTGEYSSIRLGDGTNIAGVTAANELKVVANQVDLTQYKYLEEATDGVVATTKY
jgi:hypothetical protein